MAPDSWKICQDVISHILIVFIIIKESFEAKSEIYLFLRPRIRDNCEEWKCTLIELL